MSEQNNIAVRFKNVCKTYRLYTSSRRRLLGLFFKSVPHKTKHAVVDMNDGKLEMLLIRKPETLPDLHRLILALKNNDFSDKHIDFASASTFRLHAAAGFDWSIDGEYAAGGIDTVIRCVKDAVCIAAPRVENG